MHRNSWPADISSGSRTAASLLKSVMANTDRTLSPEPKEVASAHTIFRVSPERIQGRQIQKSNTSPNVITTEDNKIHIHFGNPHIQAATPVSRPMSPCSTIHEIRTPAISNGTPNKSTNKITSCITITPTATPAPRHSQITVSNVYD